MKKIETQKFVKNKFSEYYQEHSSSIQPPTLIEKREFGFLMFKGKVIEISDLGAIVKLKILAGKRFNVQITKKSFDEMQINLGSKVFLTFKASSVQII